MFVRFGFICLVSICQSAKEVSVHWPSSDSSISAFEVPSRLMYTYQLLCLHSIWPALLYNLPFYIQFCVPWYVACAHDVSCEKIVLFSWFASCRCVLQGCGCFVCTCLCCWEEGVCNLGAHLTKMTLICQLKNKVGWHVFDACNNSSSPACRHAHSFIALAWSGCLDMCCDISANFIPMQLKFRKNFRAKADPIPDSVRSKMDGFLKKNCAANLVCHMTEVERLRTSGTTNTSTCLWEIVDVQHGTRHNSRASQDRCITITSHVQGMWVGWVPGWCCTTMDAIKYFDKLKHIKMSGHTLL